MSPFNDDDDDSLGGDVLVHGDLVHDALVHDVLVRGVLVHDDLAHDVRVLGHCGERDDEQVDNGLVVGNGQVVGNELVDNVVPLDEVDKFVFGGSYKLVRNEVRVRDSCF